MKSKAAFFDRDGIINVKAQEHDYIKSWDEFIFIEEIFEIMKWVQNKGYLIIIVTNQRGIGRGIMTEAQLGEIHRTMVQVFGEKGIEITEIFSCPHDVVDRCECRKPKAGMLVEAIKKYDIDSRQSFLIGDSETDIIAGQRVHCKTILVNNSTVENTDYYVHDAAELFCLVKEIM